MKTSYGHYTILACHTPAKSNYMYLPVTKLPSSQPVEPTSRANQSSQPVEPTSRANQSSQPVEPVPMRNECKEIYINIAQPYNSTHGQLVDTVFNVGVIVKGFVIVDHRHGIQGCNKCGQLVRTRYKPALECHIDAIHQG